MPASPQSSPRDSSWRSRRQASSSGRDELSRAVASVSSGLRLPAHGDVHETAGHILYVTGDGYRLVERDGRAPGVEELVELDGREFVVGRVGRSPLPGDRRACAYLEPARRPQTA